MYYTLILLKEFHEGRAKPNSAYAEDQAEWSIDSKIGEMTCFQQINILQCKGRKSCESSTESGHKEKSGLRVKKVASFWNSEK